MLRVILAIPIFNSSARTPQVPLDYTEPEGEQAAVALTRLQSKYPPGHENYKGPILFNPGSLSKSIELTRLINLQVVLEVRVYQW